MKLHILSDLHLGQGALEIPPTDADLVILAGDIARPKDAVAWASKLDKPVLYVLGNHEFYGGSIAGTAARFRAQAAGTRIELLDDGARVIDGVRFLGSTLWTDFMLFDEQEQRGTAVAEAMRLMRDYSRITTTDDSQTVVTPDDTVALFRRHSTWLERELDKPHDGPTVVITHHAPSTRSIHPRFESSLLNPCFVSRAEHLLGESRVQLWIHGHTHDSFDYTVGGTRVVCNPRGYAQAGINENAAFNPGLIVEI